MKPIETISKSKHVKSWFSQFLYKIKKHLTKSKARPSCPENPKHYKIKNVALGVLQDDPKNVSLQNHKPVWR